MGNNYVGVIVSRLNTLSNSINTLEKLSNEEIMFEESNSWSKVQTTLSNLRTDISDTITKIETLGAELQEIENSFK